MEKKLVCLCNLIEETEIISTLQKGANSTADIQNLLRAGTSCGRCLTEIDQLVKVHKSKKPKGQQQKLDFGF